MFKALLEKLKWGFLALCAIFDNGIDEWEREVRDCYVDIIRVNDVYYLNMRCYGKYIVQDECYRHRNLVAEAIGDHLLRCYEYHVNGNDLVKDWIGATVRLHKSDTLRFKLNFFTDLTLHINYNKG